MDKLIIEPGNVTPTVEFDPEAGKLTLGGRSTPENSVEFYKPMMDWLEEYGASPKEKTELHVKLEYFNTSSSKCLLDIFKKIDSIFKEGNDVTVYWYYEEDDEDMEESGEDYSDLLSVPFEMVETEG